MPVETSDPEKVYKYWLGQNSPDEIELIKGYYYQSPHFTLEYELFLKFKTTDTWWDAFITQNGLELDRQPSDWKMYTEAPDWFQPGGHSVMYSKNDEYDRSRYLIDRSTGICYVFETLGM